MKTITQKTSPVINAGSVAGAFTLIELLVVIAIIGILAAILMPVFSIAMKHAKMTEAKTQIMNIHSGITAYESDYSRFPVSSAVQSVGFETYTYGGTFNSPENPAYDVGTVTNTINNGQVCSNSDVMAILLDYTNYPNGWLGGTWTVNTNYQKNPKQNVYIQVKPSGWDPTKGGTPQPGLGNDLVYRDLWGNPYVITMDLDEDNYAFDDFYQKPGVSSSNPTVTGSSAYNGLTYHTEGGVSGYAFHGNVMVWSAGPDGTIDPTNSAVGGFNKDNIISWQ